MAEDAGSEGSWSSAEWDANDVLGDTRGCTTARARDACAAVRMRCILVPCDFRDVGAGSEQDAARNVCVACRGDQPTAVHAKASPPPPAVAPGATNAAYDVTVVEETSTRAESL